MSDLSTQPNLTPQFCFNTTALRDFLRLSRATIDDSISAHLNALLQPSRLNPFVPSTTAARTMETPSNRSSQDIPTGTCTRFKKQVLYPSWKRRDEVLEYCSKISQGREDLDSNDSVKFVESVPESGPATLTGRIFSNPWGAPQQKDERTDPYSGRDYSYARAGQEEVLKEVLGDEKGVERVIKSRTWAVLRDRCMGGSEASYRGWELEYHQWRIGEES